MALVLKKKSDEFAVVRLAVPPMSYRFDAERDVDAEAKLLEVLEHKHRCTSNVLITRPEDVYFNVQALVRGRYAITTGAFSQLCSRLLPGLAQALNNLAGSTLSDADISVSQVHDPQMALRWLNDTIRLKFHRLAGYSLIIDQEQKRVEGLVGRKYAFLPNVDLYNRAKAFVSTLSKPASFNEAALLGRRLMLRFKDDAPMFTVLRPSANPEPFYSGLHFANSETGDCSVKASAVIVRQVGNTKSISEFSDGSKIAHVKGKAFEHRFTELLDRVRIKASEIGKYRAGLQILMGQPLGFGVSEADNVKRVKAIESQLLRQGLSSDFNQAVVRHMLYYGSYKSDQVDPAKNLNETYATRTAYDLYNALTYKAKSLPVDDQEIAEQVAFKLLIGKFKIQ